MLALDVKTINYELKQIYYTNISQYCLVPSDRSRQIRTIKIYVYSIFKLHNFLNDSVHVGLDFILCNSLKHRALLGIFFIILISHLPLPKIFLKIDVYINVINLKVHIIVPSKIYLDIVLLHLSTKISFKTYKQYVLRGREGDGVLLKNFKYRVSFFLF